MAQTINIKAPAKINLVLDVVGKRPDGYHTLKSIMQSVSLYDKLGFSFSQSPDQDVVLLCERDDFPKDKTNLIYKACMAFYEYSKVTPKGIIISVEKNIPSMAGMAGGSSDCGATLIALNQMYETDYSKEILCDIGEKLGADVPFCLTGGTVLCEGIGEILTPLPDLKDCFILIIKPNCSISTPESYKKFDAIENPPKSDLNDMIASLVVSDLEGISKNLFNGLERATYLEEIEEIKNIMNKNNALGSAMTGSGSAVFGLFKSKKEAKDCLKHFDDNDDYFKTIVKPVNEGCIID
ncbi:MAG: 4-(cytidine 5'-diphospho)-2-C-methyl-D-erythritol kinase [Clostridiales bacterium]|nr:4-(cytidine 5'-diphospho)-2-C-methyl-D-erythritol kinase [Clostridiales bacterium]